MKNITKKWLVLKEKVMVDKRIDLLIEGAKE